MNSIFEIIGTLLILIGSIFLFLGGLGIFRMPDVYNRLQAGTKATTLGGMSLIFGVGFLMVETNWAWMVKTMIIVIFIAFSNPISSHALARAMYKEKRYPLITSKDKDMDAYKEVTENERKEDKS